MNQGLHLSLDPLYLGIDPGSASGCLAVLDARGGVVEVLRVKQATDADIVTFLGRHHLRIEFAVQEKVGAMPKQGVSSTFKFGENFGLVRGMLMMACIPFEQHTPQRWQRSMAIPKRDTAKETPSQFKHRLKEVAQQLFPNERVLNDTADGLLIAEYCRRWRLGLL